MVRLTAGLLTVIVAVLLATFLPSTESAEESLGDFDFYVLALSWSPSFCATTGSTDSAQCGVERHGFIVHGLWPQYESGYPEYCPSPMSDRVPNTIVDSVFDIMPSTGLIRSQWTKHGVCTGLDQSRYFDILRRAFGKISIPEDYVAPMRDESRNPGAIEAAFIAANSDLSADGVAIACNQRQLTDVRICLTKNLEFRACREVDRKGCRAREINIPGLQ